MRCIGFVVMVQFNYKGYRESGEKVEGEVVSENRETALSKLKKEGIIPIELNNKVAGGIKFDKVN